MDSHPVPPERAEEIAKAIGNGVVAAAALEKALLGEIYRRQMVDDPALIADLEVFDHQFAGRLLQKLREQGIEPALADRINGVLRTRNRLIHGFFEDMEVARAVWTGDGLGAVMDGIKQIEVDCAALIAELQPLLAAEIAEQLGMPLEDVAQAVLHADLSKVEDPMQRAALEQAREMIELTGWPAPDTPKSQED